MYSSEFALLVFLFVVPAWKAVSQSELVFHRSVGSFLFADSAVCSWFSHLILSNVAFVLRAFQNLSIRSADRIGTTLGPLGLMALSGLRFAEVLAMSMVPGGCQSSGSARSVAFR